MIKLAIPVLHVSNAKAAKDFYCTGLGFRHEFEYRAEKAKADPCYMGLSRDGVWIHVSSFPGDGVSGGVVNLVVDDVEALYAEFVAKQVRIAVGPVDQTWGTREMNVQDPDGNSIRYQAAPKACS